MLVGYRYRYWFDLLSAQLENGSMYVCIWKSVIGNRVFGWIEVGYSYVGAFISIAIGNGYYEKRSTKFARTYARRMGERKWNVIINMFRVIAEAMGDTTDTIDMFSRNGFDMLHVGLQSHSHHHIGVTTYTSSLCSVLYEALETKRTLQIDILWVFRIIVDFNDGAIQMLCIPFVSNGVPKSVASYTIPIHKGPRG
jgi:hypothetical protein